jgi:hypothetical protein
MQLSASKLSVFRLDELDAELGALMAMRNFCVT